VHIIASSQARRLPLSGWFGDNFSSHYTTRAKRKDIEIDTRQNKRLETAQKRLDEMTSNAPACSQPFNLHLGVLSNRGRFHGRMQCPSMP
jgi:hypothetical protein